MATEVNFMENLFLGHFDSESYDRFPLKFSGCPSFYLGMRAQT
jgi:hypothetical protein